MHTCLFCRYLFSGHKYRWGEIQSHQNIHSRFPCKTEQHTNYVHNFNDIKTRARKSMYDAPLRRNAAMCRSIAFGSFAAFDSKFEYLCVCFICQTVFSTVDIRHTDNKTLSNVCRTPKKTEEPSIGKHAHKKPE